MSFPIATDKFYVTQDQSGNCITVRPDPDYPDGSILITNTNESSKDYFGPIYLIGSVEFMKKIGQSILDCANDIEKYND